MKIGDRLQYRMPEMRLIDSQSILERIIVDITKESITYQEKHINGKKKLLSTPKFIIEEIFNVINPKKEKFDEELKKL
jgi:hypothetical protein